MRYMRIVFVHLHQSFDLWVCTDCTPMIHTALFQQSIASTSCLEVKEKITTSDLSFPLSYIPLSWQSKGDSCWKCTSKESATLESCSASLQVSRMNKITGHPNQLFELPLYLPSLEWFIITYDIINNSYYEDVSALGYVTHCDGEKDFIRGFTPSRLAF